MKQSLSEQALEIFRSYVNEKFEGKVHPAAASLGLSQSSGILRKWLNGERTPDIQSLISPLEMIGYEIVIKPLGLDTHGSDVKKGLEIIADLRKEIAKKESEIVALQKAVENERGQRQALEKQIERLVPSPKDGPSILIDKKLIG